MSPADKQYPADMTPALAEVLGMPPWQLQPYWQALRAIGQPIATRFEAENAAALHYLIPLAIEHGEGWEKVAHADLGPKLEVALAEERARLDAEKLPLVCTCQGGENQPEGAQLRADDCPMHGIEI